MFKSVFCMTSVLEICLQQKRLLIQQVDFVNSRHFFQHQSRAKHWFKNLKILMTSKFQLNIFSFLFSGFYLFLQVHFTSLHSQNVKLRHYLCIGWGELIFFHSFFHFFSVKVKEEVFCEKALNHWILGPY